MTEDHTDKSLLERAEELLPRLRYGAAWTRDMLKGGHVTALNVAPTMDDAAQVISDLKTALEETRAENERLQEHLGAEEATYRNEVELSSAQSTIASLREELERAETEDRALLVAAQNCVDTYPALGWSTTTSANEWAKFYLTELAAALRRILDEKEKDDT